jgi:hypothetical protein
MDSVSFYYHHPYIFPKVTSVVAITAMVLVIMTATTVITIKSVAAAGASDFAPSALAKDPGDEKNSAPGKIIGPDAKK